MNIVGRIAYALMFGYKQIAMTGKFRAYAIRSYYNELTLTSDTKNYAT